MARLTRSFAIVLIAAMVAIPACGSKSVTIRGMYIRGIPSQSTTCATYPGAQAAGASVVVKKQNGTILGTTRTGIARTSAQPQTADGSGVATLCIATAPYLVTVPKERSYVLSFAGAARPPVSFDTLQNDGFVYNAPGTSTGSAPVK